MAFKMFAVGTLGNYLTQGVYTVAGPFHPFGGAVDIVVVQQKDGTFKSSPWYVKFGKFQGVLTRKEKVVDVTVNDVPTDFHMYLHHTGEAFFEKEVQYDGETLLSLPGASSARDAVAELGRQKRLTYSNDSTAEGLEMQEVLNRDSGTKPVGIMNECNNPNSGMSDDVIIAPVRTASNARVPNTSLNQSDNEVAIASSETNCSLVEEQNGTSNSNEKKLEREESKPARSGRRLAKLFVPIVGMGLGRKSQQASPDTSSAHGDRQSGAANLKSSVSLERAEMVADLLDRKWVTGCREILLTPTKRWQRTAAATGAGIDNSLSVDAGTSMFGSVGSGGVLNDASSGQSEFGQCSRPDTFTESSKHAIRDDSNFVETGSLMRSSEGSADVINAASSRQSECEEFSRPEIHTEAFEQSIMENTAMDDLQADMMRLETFGNREFAGEQGSFLHSAPEEQTSILVSNGSSGDISSSNDSLCKSIYEGDQNGRCHAAYTGNEQVTLVGTTDEDVDRSTEGLPSPGVLLMSGDGHVIIAPVDVENNQLHNNECGQQVDTSREFPSGASCIDDVQVVASSSGDSEPFESDRSKRPAAVSVSSTLRAMGAAVASELIQVSGDSEELIRIEELPAGLLDGEVVAGKASEFSSRDTKSTSTEMTPEFVSEVKFKASEDGKGASSQNPKMGSEHMVMTFLTAADESWEEHDDCAREYPVVRKLTVGQNEVDVQRDTGINTDQSGTAAGCLPGDVVRDTRILAPPSDSRLPIQMEADSLILTDVDLARPNIELDSGVLESPGQQVLEQFYSFKEGHMVDFKNDDSEDDVLKNCLYLEELPNCSGDDTVVAFLEVDDALFELGHDGYTGDNFVKAVSEVDDPVFDERHDEQNLSSCKTMDSDLSEQPKEARSGAFTWVRSKPVPARQGAIKKTGQLRSSASVPCRMHAAEREVHAYSRSVGSSPLYNVNPLRVKADATNSFNKDMAESVRIVDLVDMQVIKAIIYGSGKDSEIIVNAADDSKSPPVAVDLSLCRHLLLDGMGANAAAKVFASHKVTFEKFQHSGSAMFADDKLVVKIGERYFSWVEAAPYILDMGAAGSEAVQKIKGGIAVETNGLTKDEESQAVATVPSTTGWKLPFSVRGLGSQRGPLAASTVPQQALLTATNLAIASPFTKEILQKHGYQKGATKLKLRTYVPTSQQLASLRLKEGSNKVTFGFLGKKQVDARIYLWNWNTRIVVSDVDGTITRSDILGQVMPLVGRDWIQPGVTRLFSAIKDNGYELLFLSARAISQAYLTRQFLLNLKQDGERLPDGPVLISPDGLIPSFYREVIRRAPHEFKITCLEGIRELFPSDVNPFYSGFGNRDTDEISYLKVGVPKGKIFIINPKGEVANHLVNSKSYSSFHTLVDDMFPPMSSGEQEDFNTWNFWKLPLPDIDDELNVKRAKSSRRVAGSKRAV